MRARNKLHDYLAYLALRLVAMVIYMAPSLVVYRLAGWVGDLWYRLDGRHRDRAGQHMRESFPDWPEEKIQSVIAGSFRNLVYLVIEILLTTRLITCIRWRKYIVFNRTPEMFRRLLGHDSAMIFISGHFGGWEVLGYAMATLGFKGYALARPLDNPYLNKHLMGIREKTGLRILDKAGATQYLEGILNEGNYVGFIADQDAGPRGVFVDFFGRSASTYKAPAIMAIAHNLPIAISYARRVNEQFRFEAGVQRTIYPNEWADKKDPVTWITQQYTTALENVIRSAPEQYLWIYRRWKTPPRKKIAKKDDAALRS